MAAPLFRLEEHRFSSTEEHRFSLTEEHRFGSTVEHRFSSTEEHRFSWQLLFRLASRENEQEQE